METVNIRSSVDWLMNRQAAIFEPRRPAVSSHTKNRRFFNEWYVQIVQYIAAVVVAMFISDFVYSFLVVCFLFYFTCMKNRMVAVSIRLYTQSSVN